MDSEPQSYNERHGVRLDVDHATSAQITIHLERCDSSFVPQLSQRCDLKEYAGKIRENAVTFEAWCANDLVGLVAAYLNAEDRRTGYVTSVSVDEEFRGGGLASTLMRECTRYASRLGFETVALEVSNRNDRAIQLYRRLGFEPAGQSGELVRMNLVLEGVESP